jgi:thiol-disulfide isomerase/thioredoxin
MEINPSKLLYYQKVVLGAVSLLIVGLLTYYSIWVSQKKESPKGPDQLSLIPIEQRKPIKLDLALSGSVAEGAFYLQVWAHHCAPCLEEIPALLSWPELKNIKTLFLNVDDKEEQKILARAWLKSIPTQDFEFAFDQGSYPFDDNKVLPRHLIIDRHGKIAADYSGMILNHRAEWTKLLLEAVKEQDL